MEAGPCSELGADRASSIESGIVESISRGGTNSTARRLQKLSFAEIKNRYSRAIDSTAPETGRFDFRAGRGYTLAGMRVVIADDSADFREMLQAVLATARGQFVVVGEARTGDETIAVVNELQPDALLLDLTMPSSDGLQILPAIRAGSPRTRVIVLSGFDQGQAGRLNWSAEADAHVVKGRPIAELLGVLRRVCPAA